VGLQEEPVPCGKGSVQAAQKENAGDPALEEAERGTAVIVIPPHLHRSWPITPSCIDPAGQGGVFKYHHFELCDWSCSLLQNQ